MKFNLKKFWKKNKTVIIIVLIILAIGLGVLIFLLTKPDDGPSKSPDDAPSKPRIEDSTQKEKFISGWKSSVPTSSQNTKLNNIKMYNRFNNMKNALIKTPIIVGDTLIDVTRNAHLNITKLKENILSFQTVFEGKNYYLTYSKNGNQKEMLTPGQIYWSLNPKDHIYLFLNDKKILFLSENNQPSDLQLYFHWYGNKYNDRSLDAGYFVLKNKKDISLNNKNLVEYQFEEKDDNIEIKNKPKKETTENDNTEEDPKNNIIEDQELSIKLTSPLA